MIKLDTTNREIIVAPSFIFKVFKITDNEILSKGDIGGVIIYYRFTQDYGRTSSAWVEFTVENIRSERINPIRFFQIEYLVNYVGTTSVTIFDINLIGDFQNVSLDGQKSNLYGIREDCNSLILSITGDADTLTDPDTSMLMGKQDQTADPNLPTLLPADIAKLYQPYQQAQGLALYNKLANDITEVFGHNVVYILTDPDENGIDYTFHEYQLQNYVCEAELKVSVDNNQFPENNGALNGFDLTLFENFEIQITKEQFKSKFGSEKRPGISDVIWFCNINMIYRIEHTNAIRSFNNYSIYYKISLKKWNNNKSIIGATPEMQSIIDGLTHNNTLGELMGLEKMQDKKAVSMTEQFRTAAQDILRVDIFANIEQDVIENASRTIAKTHYELSTVGVGNKAVVYRNFKYFYQKSDNIGYMCWFNINNIDMTSGYNFFHYYDANDENGFIFYLLGNNIVVVLNDTTYTLPLSNKTTNVLNENIWYSLVVNIDQRQSLLTAYIYKRNCEYEEDAVNLGSSKLAQLYKVSCSITPSVIELGPTINASILGSDAKMTNIRMFLDIIPESEHNKILNTDIIGADYKYIIFADHVDRDVVLPFYADSKVDYNKIRRGTGLDNT